MLDRFASDENGSEQFTTESDLQRIRADAWQQEYRGLLREREIMTIRHRVQKRVDAPEETLKEIIQALERCEQALGEMHKLAREWRLFSQAVPALTD